MQNILDSHPPYGCLITTTQYFYILDTACQYLISLCK